MWFEFVLLLLLMANKIQQFLELLYITKSTSITRTVQYGTVRIYYYSIISCARITLHTQTHNIVQVHRNGTSNKN